MTVACPMNDAGGTPGGVGFELRVSARLLQRRQPGGQLHWQFDFDLRDVRLAALGFVGLRDLVT